MLDQAHHIQREVNNYYFAVVTQGGTKKCLQNALKIMTPPDFMSGNVTEHALDSSLMLGD